MPKYTKEFTEKVLKATDIVKVINTYTPLIARDDHYLGHSPFTRAKQATLVVYPKSQTFKDFGCKEAGNVFIFLSHKEGISFEQAVEKLAKAAHIPITEADLYKDPQATLKKNLYDIMEAAATFYHNQMKAAGGEVAKEYVTQRGLKDETVKQFKLGFAPGTGQALYGYLQHQGFTHDIMIKSGLIKVADGRPYDYFRNRLMFPIWNKDGKIVAFTGRILKTEPTKEEIHSTVQQDTKTNKTTSERTSQTPTAQTDDAPETKLEAKKGPPKYVNSATSPIFNKSEALYGINFAKNTQKPYYILVEGQMDVIKLHQSGFDNVVAISGVAFTEIHCQELQTKTYKGKEVQQKGLMIATDGDSAGREAKLKIIKKGSEFLPFGMRVVEWPSEYKDPDEVIEKCGKEFFQECLLSGSIPADNYVMLMAVQKHTDPETGETNWDAVTKDFVEMFTMKEQKGMSMKEIDERMSSVVTDLAEPSREL